MRRAEARTATFRIPEWDATKDTPYALAYAASSGGGILNGSLSGIGRLEITSSTIASNTAVNGGGILTSAAEIGNNAATTLRSTIIAGSTPNNLKTDVNPGATATITSLGFNLTDDNSNQFLNQATDLINTNPLLAPLALNGGQTPTHALLFGSRALDAGHSSGATTDQRGAVRPFDILAACRRGNLSAPLTAVEGQILPQFKAIRGFFSLVYLMLQSLDTLIPGCYAAA